MSPNILSLSIFLFFSTPTIVIADDHHCPICIDSASHAEDDTVSTISDETYHLRCIFSEPHTIFQPFLTEHRATTIQPVIDALPNNVSFFASSKLHRFSRPIAVNVKFASYMDHFITPSFSTASSPTQQDVILLAISLFVTSCIAKHSGIMRILLVIALLVNFKPRSADFIDAGYAYTCALLESSRGNRLKCWGLNSDGQLGYEDNVQRSAPDVLAIDFGTSYYAEQLSVGIEHACVVSAGNEAKCFGKNSDGQLGYGDYVDRGALNNSMGNDLPVIDFANNFVPSAIECGGRHTCALSSNGDVRCWGYNYNGQLGYEVAANYRPAPSSTNIDLGTGFRAISMALGYYHTCVVSDKGRLKCFGWGGYGQLGTGDITDKGKTSGTMGDNLQSVDLGSDFNVTKVCCGNHFTCAVSEDSRVKCFGQNIYGQLGAGDTVNRGQSNDSMGDNLAAVDLGPGFLAQDVQCGYFHVCALSRDHRVACWGDNNYGQLGLGDTQNRGDQPGEMGINLTAVDLGTSFVPVQIGLGASHTCATSEDNKFKCFGSNGNGQLGDRSVYSIGDNTIEMGDNLPIIDMGPTFIPTNSPSRSPSTQSPSGHPTKTPPTYPTVTPSWSPSSPPTRTETANPTMATALPTSSQSPSRSPSDTPSNQPSQFPSNTPSATPTRTTSLAPTGAPTARSGDESSAETLEPTETEQQDEQLGTKSESLTTNLWLLIVMLLAAGICFGFAIAAVCYLCFWKRRNNSDVQKHIENVEMMISSQSESNPQLQAKNGEDGEAADAFSGIIGNDEGHQHQTPGAPIQRDEFEVFEHDERAMKAYRPSTATTLNAQRAEGKMLGDAIDEEVGQDEDEQQCVAMPATVRPTTNGVTVTDDGGVIDESELDEIQSWLRETVQLEQYWDNFAVNGYDTMQRIKSIGSAVELAEIGIVSDEHQKRMLQAIQQMQIKSI